MNWRHRPIEEIEALVRPGDILAFSGHGLISTVVKLITHSSISHIGIVLDPSPGAQIIESTSLRGFAGVTIGSLVQRCSEYDGSIWLLRLRDSLPGNRQALQQWLRAQNLEPYDTWGAVESAFRVHHAQGGDRWFCSELAAAALQAIGVLPEGTRPNEIRPCDLIRLPIFCEDYYQIKGELEQV